jgi:hypothetical protein
MRACMLRVGVLVLAGTLLGALSGCSHDPNHDIDMEKARKAAEQIHPPPKLSPADRERFMRDKGG